MISIVVPVYNEDENIYGCVNGLWNVLEHDSHEILICYDFDEDTTVAALGRMPDRPPSVRLVRNKLGPGPANAIRAGVADAKGDVVVVTMADLSDPPDVIPAMVDKVRRGGADVVSGSRYMRGGSQTGGPALKGFLARAAGLTLHFLAGVGTHDATNSFRAFSRRFLDAVEIESETGFTIGLELTVKAHLRGDRVDEVPSSWSDRSAGESRFRLAKWLPAYLRWFAAGLAAPLVALAAWGGAAVIAHGGAFAPWLADSRLLGRAAAGLAVLGGLRWLRGRTVLGDALIAPAWFLGGAAGLGVAAALSAGAGYLASRSARRSA